MSINDAYIVTGMLSMRRMLELVSSPAAIAMTLLFFGFYGNVVTLIYPLEKYQQGLSVGLSCAMPLSPQTVPEQLELYWKNTLWDDSTNTLSLLATIKQKAQDDEISHEVHKAVPNLSIKFNLSSWTIVASLQNVTCTDSAYFQCYMQERKPPNLRFRQFRQEYITIVEKPGKTSIQVHPKMESYEVNTLLQLNCSGSMGRNTKFLKVTWIWEYRNFREKEWNRYPQPFDIAFDPSVLPPSNSCQVSQVTRLNRNLTLADHKREYRCFVAWVTQKPETFPPTAFYQYASSFYIEEVRPEGALITMRISNDSVAPTIGIVFLVICALNLVTVLIFIKYHLHSKLSADLKQ